MARQETRRFALLGSLLVSSAVIAGLIVPADQAQARGRFGGAGVGGGGHHFGGAGFGSVHHAGAFTAQASQGQGGQSRS